MKKIVLLLIVVSSIVSGSVKLANSGKIDIVYKIKLDKYPKFLCEAILQNGKVVQFVSVKSMFQVYFHQEYFLKHKLLNAKIRKMYVKDYLTGKKVNARDAFFVFGSRLVGPHGDDLIPCSNKDSLKLFKIKYGGTKVLRFKQISAGLIKYLDM